MSSSPFNPLGPAHDTSRDPQTELESRPARRAGVFFASKEDHTREIAERIMLDLRKGGFDVDLHDVRIPLAFDLSHYCAAVLAASVHQGNHEKEMIRFVRDHRSELERMPTAFISVTLSEAGAERREATPAEHIQFVADVNKMLDTFFKQTEWYPTYVKPVAGALTYSKYNFFIRFIMKRIARKQRADTDTSRDYDYTNWIELDKFVENLAAEIRIASVAASSPENPTETARRANHA
ncbi:MAG: protoporphyrinogen oxidase [Acidobacteriia bacterium]|nr:protoporphyrinogen oxidase [Terriglobia bacterium]